MDEQLRRSNRAKTAARKETSIKSRMEGKFEWLHSTLGRVRANTKSEARAKFRILAGSAGVVGTIFKGAAVQ